MSLREDLLAKADAYCTANSISRAALGELVMKDNKFFGAVADGDRGFTVSTYERVIGALKKSLADLRAEAARACSRRKRSARSHASAPTTTNNNRQLNRR